MNLSVTFPGEELSNRSTHNKAEELSGCRDAFL